MKLLAGCTVLLLLAGCNIVGPAFVAIHGPEKVKREYALDKERTTVVFIDDRANVLPRRTLRRDIGRSAQEMLIKKSGLKDVIDADSALQLAAAENYDAPRTIGSIGRELGADIVVYVTVDEFLVSTDGISYTPKVSMRCKVIDAANDTRLWPMGNNEQNGHAFAVAPPVSPSDTPTSNAALVRAQKDLAQLAGIGISQLFHEHELQNSVIR